MTTATISPPTPEAADAALPLRRLPSPRSEPPYDDEPVETARSRATGDNLVAAGVDGVQGTLALAFVLPSGLPVTPELPRLRLVRREPALAAGASAASPPHAARRHQDPDDEEPADGYRDRTPRALLPDPRPWAGRLAQAIIEVLAGERPAAQLVRWTNADVFADVQRRVRIAARRCPPGRTGERRPVLRSVRVSEPSDGIAEVCALVQRGARVTALALRLDGLEGRWQCTALEVG